MKKFTIEVSHASPAQLATIGLELKVMSNGWERFGPRIYINSQKLQAPSLHEKRYKRQASSLTSSKHQDKMGDMKEIKTITIPGIFGGEKNITLEEFQKRWRGHPQEIWTFLVDHGTVEEMKLGEKLVELFPKVVEKAFNHFYEEKNARQRS